MSTKRFLPLLLILSLTACCIEVDISVPSFPAMLDYFQSTQSLIQLTIGINFLGFCLGSSIVGPLSDAWGRRKVMLIGNAVMSLGALGCALSSHILFLLFSRFIQGLGAATSVVVATVMIIESYNEIHSAKLIGLMNAVFTTLMSLAPLFGSYLQSHYGWQSNYTIVALLSLFSWICLIGWLPETLKAPKAFSLRSIIHEYTVLLKRYTFIRYSLVPSLLYALFLSFISSAPFLYVSTFGLNNGYYATHQAVIVGSFAIVSIILEKLMNKVGEKQTIQLALISTILGMACLIVSGLMPNPYLYTFSMVLYCIGFACLYPIIFTKSLNIIPSLKGAASSLNMSLRAIIIFLVVGLTSLLHTTPLSLSLVLLAPFLIILILMKVDLSNSPSL